MPDVADAKETKPRVDPRMTGMVVCIIVALLLYLLGIPIYSMQHKPLLFTVMLDGNEDSSVDPVHSSDSK